MKKLLLSLVIMAAFLPFAAQAQEKSTPSVVDNIEACDSYLWIDGQTYTADTNVFFSLNDTLHVLILKINNSVANSESVTANCSYEWNGNTYITAGEYVDTLTASNQCDSVVTLTLAFTKKAFDTLAPVSVCGQYIWGQRTLTASGTYFDTLHVEETNCDSISILSLNITNLIVSNETVEHCGTYTWRTRSLVEGGSYHDTIANPGCDSIFNLDLTIKEINDTLDSVTACASYKWNKTGQTYTTTGWQTKTTTAADGCVTNTSIFITIKTLDTITNVTDTTSCGYVYYKFAKVSPAYKVYSDSTAQHLYTDHTVNYCHDSLSIVNFHVNQAVRVVDDIVTCDTFTWNGNLYTFSARDSIKMGRAVNGCDSFYVANIIINKSPVITSIDGHWRLANPGETATLHATCDQEDVTFEWIYDGNVEEGESIEIENVTENTDVLLTVSSNSSSCYAEGWITILVGVGIDNVEAAQINLYPNPTVKKLNIEAAENIETVVIYNMIGQQVMKLHNLGAQNSIDMTALSNGTYTMRIDLQNGQCINRKFVISK